MARLSVRVAVAVGVLSVGAAVVAVGERPRPPAAVQLATHPPPSTKVLFEQAEERGKKGRRQWLADLHRAPPGVDWERVEADNGRVRMDARRLERSNLPGLWVERGSENQAGSMHDLRSTTDGTGWVAGSELGGVWRGTRDGSAWTPLGDNLYGGVHHLWVGAPDVPGDPDVLLVSPDWGAVYRSDDDGASWHTPAGLGDLIGIRNMLGTDSGVVFLAGVTAAWDLSVLRSRDGGRTFEPVLASGQVFGDLWIPRDGGSGIWVLGSDTLYWSDDLGETWVEAALPATISQGRLAGSEATDPPRIYFEDRDWYGPARLYRSDDAGASWFDLGTHEDAWEVLTASAVDPDLVVYGGVELHRSTDAGASFEVVNTWDAYYDHPESRLHADMMGVTVTPDGLGGETWGIGCHGGVYTSDDGLQTVRNLSLTGLRVSQYYSTLTSRTDGGRVLAGSQDQGLQWARAAPFEGDGPFDLEQHLSGDFGHLVSTDGEHERVFAVYPGFVLTFTGEDVGELGILEYPPDDGFAPWLPVLVAHPDKKKQFFFLGAHLWRYRLVDDRWDVEQWSTRDFGASEGEYGSAMAFDPLDPERAFLATSLGRVFRSEDGGVKWTKLDVVAPEPSYLYAASLVVSGLTPGVVVIGGSGYDGAPVYRSVDGGETWAPWSEGLPATVVYTLAELRDGSGRIVAGTETSAWMRAPESDTWVDISAAGAPVTPYFSAEVLAMEDTVRFSTFGRGVWDFQVEPQGQGCWATLDADLDGAMCEHDCDDGDPTAFPGAEEQCDGRDTDCDGVPELDADGDRVFDCEDCDDGDPGTHPGATEVLCDGIDNDCDGSDLCPALTGSGCSCGGSGVPGWPVGLLALVGVSRRSGRRRRWRSPPRTLRRTGGSP